MSEAYETENELKHLKDDLVDRIRSEINWELRRYMRRLKADALEHGEAALAANPHGDIKKIASEAVEQAQAKALVQLDEQKVLDA